MDHHGVVKAEGVETERRRPRIPEEILVTPRGTVVILAAVGFEDQDPVEEKVHPPSYLGDPHLCLQRDADPVQAQPEQRLEPAVCVGPREIDEVPHRRRQTGPDLFAHPAGQKSAMPGRLECREEALSPLTARDLDERQHDRRASEP